MLQISAYSIEKIYRKSILHEGNQNLANILYSVGENIFQGIRLELNNYEILELLWSTIVVRHASKSLKSKMSKIKKFDGK